MTDFKSDKEILTRYVYLIQKKCRLETNGGENHLQRLFKVVMDTNGSDVSRE